MRRRVGANLLWLVPGVVGGSEEYTMRLLGAFADRGSAEVELVLLVNRRLVDAYPEVLARFETVVAPVDGSSKAVRVLAEATWLAVVARRRRLELVHHLGGTMPMLRSVPGVVTVHDLQPFALPEHFSRVKRAYLRVVLPTSVRAARRVVTLADFTRRDLEARLHVPAERIALVPSGVATADGAAEMDRLEAARARYGLVDRRYFLYPAITYPHKNHLVLLHALARLGESDADVILVLTGGAARSERRVGQEAEALGIAQRVVRTGRIPREDLDSLYRGAVGLLFPSRFEGFGLPVLEAMVRDCPVVAADATALPEVVGDAGLLVGATDPPAWAAAMTSLLHDPQRRDELVQRGRRRAAGFTWGEAAARLERVELDVLESLQ